MTLTLCPCPQSSGGGRASGARPGAAQEEVFCTAEREVCDAVIPSTSSHQKRRITYVKESGSRQQQKKNGTIVFRSSTTCCLTGWCGLKSAVRGHLDTADPRRVLLNQYGYFPMETQMAQNPSEAPLCLGSESTFILVCFPLILSIIKCSARLHLITKDQCN